MPTIKWELEDKRFCRDKKQWKKDCPCCLERLISPNYYCNYFEKQLIEKEFEDGYHTIRLPECIKELGK